MKLRSGKMTKGNSELAGNATDKTNSKSQVAMVLRSGRVTKQKGKPAGVAANKAISKLSRVSDACLFEALKFLPRGDVDQLPMVGRRFNRLLSHAYFQSAPLRVLAHYAYKTPDRSYLAVPTEMERRYPRFMKQLEKTATRLDRFIVLFLQSPWLRCKRTHLTIDQPEAIAKFVGIRRLWEGGRLTIKGCGMSKTAINIAPLISGCSRLVCHATNGRLSLDDCEMNSDGMPTTLILYRQHGTSFYGLTLDRLITDFLIPGGQQSAKRTLSLINISLKEEDITLERLVEITEKRFISLEEPNLFHIFVCPMESNGLPPIQKRFEIRKVKHPNPTIGECTIKMDYRYGNYYQCNMYYTGRSVPMIRLQ